MAIMKAGPLGQVSGRLGGVEFALRGGKSVVKQCKTRRSRVSDRTIAAQQGQARALKRWEGLTDEQRLAWETVAAQKPVPDRFGVERLRTGRELFLTIPHDWRFGASPSWQDTPPTNVFAWQVEPVIGALTTTVLIVQATPTPFPTPNYCNLWAARFTKDYLRHNRGWFKVGPVRRDTIDPFWNFTSVLAAQDIEFLSGETVAFRASFWQLNYWPQVWDFGTRTVP